MSTSGVSISIGSDGPSVSAKRVVGFRYLIRGAYELSNDPARLNSMEGLRGLAVLMVFFVHFHALFGDYVLQSPILWRPSQFFGIVGNAGVDLFFVLSGYLIYGALIRHSVGLLGFLRRRIGRIYPAFLAVFALYLVLSFAFPHASKIQDLTGVAKVVYIVQNLLLLPGMLEIKPIITLAWSLSYEFFFYISAAVVIRATRMWTWNRRYRWLFFIALGCGYMAFCFFASRSHVRLLMFVVGILLFEALSNKAFQISLTKPGEIVAIALFLASIAFAYLMAVRKDLFSSLPGWGTGGDSAPGLAVYHGPYKTIALSISMFWCTAYCIAFNGRLKRLFSWAPFRYLGNMSYSYYLIHGLTLQGMAMVWAFFSSHGATGVPLFVSALLTGPAATWISSTALFLYVEKPYSLRKATHSAPADARKAVRA